MQELFETRNGRVIMDEDLSSKMYLIKQYHPEKADETSSGFEWSEMGMANLFGLLYSHEARYCPEHKSWYTYHEGAWRKDEGAILVSEKIKDFVRLMILYCGEIEDDDTRKSYTGFVNKMGDRRMRDRILKDATGELRISAEMCIRDRYVPSTYTKRHCGRKKRKSFVRNIGDSVSYTSNAPRECEKHLNIEDDNLHRKDKNLSFRY